MTDTTSGVTSAMDLNQAWADLKPAERENDPAHLKTEILAKLAYAVGKDPVVANSSDWLTATILVVRDHIVDRWMASTRENYRAEKKRVYYLSLEFLIGRLFRDAMNNLELTSGITQALSELDVDIDFIRELEPDAALGNGGLGRLAACFMESMATVGVPAYGYGIRYDNGLFRQAIEDGAQVEYPENWLAFGDPWEFPRREAAYTIGFGGSVEVTKDWDGATTSSWKPQETVMATAYDTPVVGWRGEKVNTLRLWRARPTSPIKLDLFNSGDHMGALSESNRAKSISRVLYPADSSEAGQELRLRQEFFFTSASLQDILRRHLQQYDTLDNLADKVAVQMNDTHPALAVAELMRLLVDQHNLKWDEAWTKTQAVLSYTNHTLLPEALETWPVNLVERMLPRHMQIIYTINARLLTDVKTAGHSEEILEKVSLIDEHGGRRVRMGNLSFVGAHKVNGVAGLHSDLMKVTVFKELHQVFPDRITNKTNGVTPRRWLMQANPGLTQLLRDTIGDGFMDNTEKLRDLEPFAQNPAFRAKFAAVKLENKTRLAHLIHERTGVKVDPTAMFDIQVKRMHEYKRQHLNILETIALYNAIRANPHKNWAPRVKVFAGKAAASYWQAKSIIRLINDVGNVVNNDSAVRDLLKVVFIPNYNVSAAEVIMPAADLSEQISTAGLEASGTGNMKFGLSGALTIGTLDGANVEMLEHVGADNIKIFGMTAQEVEALRIKGYNPRATIEGIPALKEVLDGIASGIFSPSDKNRYAGLVDSLWNSDHFLVAADFEAYTAAQREMDALWHDQDAWMTKAVLNTARMGWFSSDRTIREYAQEIWNVPTV
ncbi:alpha-1,4 glucan phosphorylase [Formosimonas limnophila]|uniref:Alpha-1,4 glucan phosphorylase n=1 Tax=Formosimonas limnophila TaxID=1384487 RepID=A0A8J3FZ75_9BURK|nr:glycogen/starch/alpha-glucan phosphorylase [Formosimonas limnophila]GHA79187.1 alpha-1,4 glucan phosphorylase [Formosimonas limnophila]